MTETLTTHPLAAVRALRGWSQSDVAQIVQRRSGLNMAVHRKKAWRWERGVEPERAAQLALADELGVAHDLVDAHPWPGWLMTVSHYEPADGVWTPDAAREVLGHVVESALMDRRGFLTMTGTATTGLALTWSGAGPALAGVGVEGGRVTAAAVDHIQARIEHLWHLDDVLGGGGCLDQGVSDLRMISRLIADGRYAPQVGTRLWSLAAGLARFCGWAAFDGGRHAAAQRLWHAALRCSAVAGDRDQGVYTLSNLALQAAYTGDGPTNVQVLAVARERVDPAARTVLAMLDCWSTRGHALSGDARPVASTLNRADSLWENRVEGDDPPWVYWMKQPSLTAEAATALSDVGDHAAAERCLLAGLAVRAPLGARDHALYLSRLAEVRVRDGRLDEAAEAARGAIESEARADSVRIRCRVDHALDLMPAGEPAVVELRDYRRELASAA